MKHLLAVIALAGVALPFASHAQGTMLGESHARSAMTSFGCGSISSLSAGPGGSWHGQCVKGGATVNVMMDSKGTVTSGAAPTHITESQARSALTSLGCSSISTLGAGPNGSWHGQCAKGGATVNAMVDNKGVATTGGTPTHVTESQARSILTGAGCSAITSLNMGMDSAWHGQCAKGGKTVDAMVDSKGAATTN